MEAVDRISVAILYRHQLFGEGIAHYLASEPDVLVQCVPMCAGQAPAEALPLGSDPRVVIFERADPDTAVELLEAFPDALVIDVALDGGPTYAWRRELIDSGAEAIVAVIRAVAKGDESVDGEWSRAHRTRTGRLVTAGGV